MEQLAQLSAAYPISSLIVGFIGVCIIARLCVNEMFKEKRHVGGDEILLDIEDFFMHPKDPEQ